MHKDVEGLVDTLRASVLEIAGSAVDNREELLTKSITEFQGTLLQGIDDYYGPEPEPLAKGLNHISSYASALNRMNQTVQALKTGRPGYMIDSDGGSPPEVLPAELAEALDHFMAVGVFVLRSMVNNTLELPEDEAALARAEKAGELIKIETDDPEGDLYVRSALPDDLREYITNPVDLMMDAADLSRGMMKMASDQANVLLENEAVPAEIITAYPDLFEVEDDMVKAFPPGGFPKKKPEAGADQPAARAKPAPGGQDQAGAAGDEAAGTGAADQGAGAETTDLADDTPQDPIEILARLATIMVVITGSLLQGQGGADPTQMGDQTGQTMPPAQGVPSVGLQRGEPIESVPLAKILAGEVEIDPTLADALDELETLRKQAPELALLKAKVAELSARPAPAKGVQQVVALGKGEDAGGVVDPVGAIAERLEKMRRDNPEGEGGDAAKLLIGAVHQSGGRSLLPV